MYVLLPIKVSVEMKEIFKESIQELADKYEIKEKNPTKAAGQVLGLLLGVSK